MRWGETLIDVGSLPTIVVCPSGFKPSVTPIVNLIFIGSFFGYSTQLLNLCLCRTFQSFQPLHRLYNNGRLNLQCRRGLLPYRVI